MQKETKPVNEFKRASRAELFSKARDRNPVLYDRIMSILNIKGPFDCWETTRSKDGCGYGQIRVNGQKQKIHRLVHALVFPLAEQTVVRHLCNNPACANPVHLRGGTQLDNARDRKMSGREGNHKGAANGRSVLTEADVAEIRSSTMRQSEMAKKYGVSRAVISSVVNRKSWKHV